MNAELLEFFANFDTGEGGATPPSTPEGTRIRHNGRTRMCVPFGNLGEGRQFYVNPRDATYLTRSSRPATRCPRFVGTLVWVE